MTRTHAAKALLLWFAILVLAIANGAFREAVLLPHLGTVPAHLVSGLLLCLLILTVAYLAVPWLGEGTPRQFAAIGVGWIVLTIAFEFGFGRWVQGTPWTELLEAYTFKEGNIWPLVLLVTAVAPYVAARLRGLIE